MSDFPDLLINDRSGGSLQAADRARDQIPDIEDRDDDRDERRQIGVHMPSSRRSGCK